ncbi:hypothetical protein KAT08_03755 [Candidatus Babeliales bacterium]|nr:hypothetical protein [Candidatus Babeliales bacterium]
MKRLLIILTIAFGLVFGNGYAGKQPVKQNSKSPARKKLSKKRRLSCGRIHGVDQTENKAVQTENEAVQTEIENVDQEYDNSDNQEMQIEMPLERVEGKHVIKTLFNKGKNVFVILGIGHFLALCGITNPYFYVIVTLNGVVTIFVPESAKKHAYEFVVDKTSQSYKYIMNLVKNRKSFENCKNLFDNFFSRKDDLDKDGNGSGSLV